jgi:hypothetical protein
MLILIARQYYIIYIHIGAQHNLVGRDCNTNNPAVYEGMSGKLT